MTVKTAVDRSTRTVELPQWLRNLVKLGRFYRTCESHRSNFCNFYCIICMGVSFCQKCKKDHHAKCGNRSILTAYKASGAASFRTGEMKLIWDVSDICIYVINSKQIVFIQKKGRRGRLGPSHGHERCRNCSYRIKPQCSYCSIECKVEDIMRKKTEANANPAGKRKSCEDADADSTVKAAREGKSSSVKTYRKRARKGIPRRAPFF